MSSWTNKLVKQFFGEDKPNNQRNPINKQKNSAIPTEGENDSFEFTSTTERARSLLKTQNLSFTSSSESESDSGGEEENVVNTEQLLSQTADLLKNCVKECRNINNLIKTSKVDDIKYRSLKQEINKILNSLDAIEVSEVAKLRPKIREAVKVAKTTESLLEKTFSSMDVHEYLTEKPPMQDAENQCEEVSLADLMAQDSELRFFSSNFSETLDQNEGATCQEFGIMTPGSTAEMSGLAATSPTGPIQLLVLLENGKFVLNEGPLRQVLYREDMRHRKVVPVSVVGGLHSGKSFLLNYLRKYLAAQGADNWLLTEDRRYHNGFEWQTGRSMQKSPNILMWPEPFFINDDLAVLLLDTQGSIHGETSMLVHTFIFALSTMLSSIQIYNTAEFIQMDDFVNVKVLLDYGKLMMDNCDEKAFHNLVVLVRDWKFQQNKPFGVGGGQALLNEWMKNSPEEAEHLKTCFDAIWCYLLPYPGDKAKNPTFRGALADISSDFLQMMINFVEKTLDKRKLLPKRNGRNEMVAQDFLQYARVCVDQLQDRDVTAQSIFEETAGVEHSNLVQVSVEFYEKEMLAKMPLFENIEDLHNESKVVAVNMYDFSRKFGGQNVTSKYREALLRCIQEIYENKVKKFIQSREKERQEMIENKFRAAKRQYKKGMLKFLDQDDFETPLNKHHDLLRKNAIKFFMHETKGKISDVQLVDYVKRLDKRMKEAYESNIEEYATKRQVAMTRKWDEDCKNTVESALDQYRTTLNAECGGQKICENIQSPHQRAKNQAMENMEKLRVKYLGKHTVATYAANLIHAIDKEFKQFNESNTLKKHQKQQEEVAELEGLRAQAETKFCSMLTSQGAMNLADKEKLKQLYDKSMALIEKDFFGPKSNKFGVLKCKPYIKAAKQALKSRYQEYKTICATNHCYNVLVDTFKNDIQRLKNSKISGAAVKKQHEKIKTEICGIFKEQCSNNSNFQTKLDELSKEVDTMFEAFQHEKENSAAAVKKRQEEEVCLSVDQLFKKKVADLKVGRTYVNELKPVLDEILSECHVLLKNQWRGNEVSSNAKWEEIYKNLNKECLGLVEVNSTLEPPKDEFTVACEDGVMMYNSEMNEFIEENLPESSELGDYHVTAVKLAFRVFKNSSKKLKITKEMEEEFLNRLEILFDKFKIKCSLKLREKRMKEEKNENGKSYAIGIDLGTTYSCATVYRDGKVELILNKEKQHTTPSVVYIDDKDIIVGEAAQHKGFIDPDNCISEVKRLIGRPYKDPVVQELKKIFGFTVINENDSPVIQTTKNKKKRWQVEEISAEVLKELKHQAEVHLNSEVHDAVVTIPAYFTEPQRTATMRACKLAGLNVLRLLNEPTAAAITYGVENMSDVERKVLVFDFGGGTCDISILNVKSGEFEVRGTKGDNKLGGEDFDDRLMEFVIDKIESDSEEGRKFDRTARRRLRFKCEIAKRRLTDSPEYTISLVECFDGEDIDFSVKRKDFEEICADLLERALKPVQLCLQEAGYDKSQIDEVVLAGGSSRIPKIRQMLSSFFNDKILNCDINPDEAISSGAAIEAARLTGECQTDIRVIDITPFSLGVSLVDGTISVLIAKNSKIPCKNTNRYYTAHAFQSSIQVCVYQGEYLANKDKNTLLGKFTLSNIRKAIAGATAADVTFEIDANGVLKVTAEEVNPVGKKGNANSISITKCT